ncbi:hypothetical protein FF1_035009 [Malus domestica]
MTALSSLLSFLLIIQPQISNGFETEPPKTPIEESIIDDLQLAFKVKTLTSRQLVQFYLEKIQTLNGHLRGVLEVNPDALSQADSADEQRREWESNPSARSRPLPKLHGIPILLKDNIGTRDKLNTTAGSFALLGSKVPRDAGVVAKLRSSGAVILGKGSLSEWLHIRSFSAPDGWSARGGQGVNPYNPSLEACGSSSGPAISVSANMVAVALGAETDSSIFCPSSYNSVVGFKPTVGLTSRAGVVPVSPRQDTVGPICRTVADSVHVLDAIVGIDSNDIATNEASQYIPVGGYGRFLRANGLKGKRLGIVSRLFSQVKDDQFLNQTFEQRFTTLRKQGAVLVENLDIANIEDILDSSLSGELVAILAEFKMALNPYLSKLVESPVRSLRDVIAFNKNNSVLVRKVSEYGQHLLEAAEKTNGIGAKEQEILSNLAKLSRDGFEKLMKDESLDALVTYSNSAHSILGVGGFPGIVVPAGYHDTEKYPFGICFGGLKGSEPKLIEAAYAFEQATKIRKPPPVGSQTKFMSNTANVTPEVESSKPTFTTSEERPRLATREHLKHSPLQEHSQQATISDLQQAFKQNQLTSRKLVEFYLQEIRRLNPLLSAVIEVNPDVLYQADKADYQRKSKGPNYYSGLHGIPVLLKDNIGTKDKLNTTAGSFALLGSVVPRDAGVVTRLRNAGAIILGKASLSEWAHFRSLAAPAGWSPRGGQGKNPYMLSATPCGSSSGPAISAAANLVAVTLGTETDGSILCPASFNSVVGIKPTVGLTSRAGVIPVTPRQDTIGPITRTVSDAVDVLDAIVGYDYNDQATREASKYIPRGGYKQFLQRYGLKGKRLGIVRNPFFTSGSGSLQLQSFEKHFKTLRQEGAVLVDHLEIANIDVILNFNLSGEAIASLAEFKLALNAYLKDLVVSPVRSLADVIAFNLKFSGVEMIKEFGQDIFLAAQATNGIGNNEKAALLNLAKLTKDGFEKLLKDNRLDALVTTGSDVSPVLAIGGFPGISVPAGFDKKGVPFGITFGGLKGSEPKLIQIAYGFEQATKVRKAPTFLP